MLSDIEIREALIKKLNMQNKNHDYRLLNELCVCDGEARVDIAVINGKFCGYEIKSDKDTLDRLPKQIESYNKIFDNMTIIVGIKYEKKIIASIPEWWGIKVAYKNKFKGISFKNIRRCKVNKDVDAMTVLELLWKEELLLLLKNKGLRGLSNKNRRKLRDIAVENIPLKEIKDYTKKVLKTRKDWRVD